MDNENKQELIPLEQQTITFRGLPLIVVRLPDGRPGVVLRWICDNLHLDPNAQVRRIQRTEVIANDLVYVRVQTDGGPQTMPALMLQATPYWLATVDTRRMAENDPRRLEILHYQREVVDVLYTWAQSPKTNSTDLILAEQVRQPLAPAQGASDLAWIEYHQQMTAFYQWKVATDTRIDTIEERQGEIESRLDEHRRVLAFIPEILERLGPQTITSQHYRHVQVLAKQLHLATNKPYATIYDDLKTAFQKPRIEDLLEEDWAQIEQWFRVQIERGKHDRR